jgi:hypothetical protein
LHVASFPSASRLEAALPVSEAESFAYLRDARLGSSASRLEAALPVSEAESFAYKKERPRDPCISGPFSAR